jgi:hypothetical protein
VTNLGRAVLSGERLLGRAGPLAFLTGFLVLEAMLASAMWAKLTDPELVAKSDLIVRGELIGVTRTQPTADSPPLWVGTIRVDSVLKGPPALTVALLALPSPEGPRSSTDLGYREGQRGLWFLRVRHPEGSGLYLADHPQRFVPHSKADRIQELEKAVAAAP